MKRKLTHEQVEEIKNSKQSQTFLAKLYNVSRQTIAYHLNPKEKERKNKYAKLRYQKLTPEEKKELRERNKAYQREYHRKRYNEDEEFRHLHLQRVKFYKKRRRNQDIN